MQKAVRKPPGAERTSGLRRHRVDSGRGQAMLEFLLAALVGIVLILGIIQITLIYNARSLVKLAAFNAARAAIVARASSRKDPVTISQSRDRAKRAAFLTLLPVIPALQGRINENPKSPPPDKAKYFDTFENLADATANLSSGAASGLDAVFPGRADVALYEFNGQTIDDDKNPVDCLDVRFVDPTAPIGTEAELKSATISGWSNVRFDEPGQSPGDNLIKVVVTWYYPLVIPFVNRIITAVARPTLYQAALTASGSTATIADMEKGLDDPDKMRNMIPVWATGYAFTQVTPGAMGIGGLGGGIAGAFSGITIRNPPPPPGSQVDGGDTPVGTDAYAGEVVFTKPSDNDTIRQSLGEFLVFRVRIRASFIMRMQWDRKP